jgi:hypothetical protein
MENAYTAAPILADPASTKHLASTVTSILVRAGLIDYSRQAALAASPLRGQGQGPYRGTVTLVPITRWAC